MRLWIAVLLLIALAALGLTALPRTVDWTSYRPDIEAAAIGLVGHDVMIEGSITVSLLPRPVLTARDVVLKGRTADGAGFELRANQAEASMAPGPLLAGRAVVRDLWLRRPVLRVDRVGSRDLRSWPPRWQGLAAPLLRLDLETIGIADGRIELAGEPDDRAFSLNDLSLELRSRGADGPLEAAGLFRTRNHRFTLAATFGRPDGEGVSSAKVSIEAQNGIDETTTLHFGGSVKPSGADQHVDGRMTLAGPDLQHGLAALSAATGYPSTFVSIAPSQAFLIEGPLDADAAGIRADDLQLRLSDKPGKGRVDLQLHPQLRLDLDLELPTLRLADGAGLDGFLPLDLLSKLNVPPGEIELRLRELALRGESARQAAVRLATSADGVTRVERARASLPGLIDLQFEGRLDAAGLGPRLEGRIEAVGDDLGSSLAWLGAIDGDERTGGWRRFSFESDLEVSSVEIALSAIDMRLDSSSLRGKASLRFAERRRLTLDVDVERPDLDLYLADIDGAAALDGLRTRLDGLDAEIDARFDRLTWRGLHIDEGIISAGAINGRLDLREARLSTVGDTVLTLNGEIDLDGRTAALRAGLDSRHPARALHHLDVALPLTSTRPAALALTGGMNGRFERFDIDLDADYDGGQLLIEGEAGLVDDRPWYDLTLTIGHPDHQALAGQFGLAPLVTAGDAEGALELAGRIRHDPNAAWVASGNAKLGPTSFTGSLSYAEGAFTGPFDARLSVGSPRRDSLAPFLILAGLRLAGEWTPARWLGRLPTNGLRTAWLDDVEGTLSLASKGGMAGDGLTMQAAIENGLLYVETLEASPWQGRLDAEITLERRRDQPFAAIALELDQVDATAFAKWLGVKTGLDGPLDLRFEASSVGRSAYELMAGMQGRVEIGAGPGTIEGLGIPDLKRVLTAGETSPGAPDRSLTLPYSRLSAEGRLSRGILDLDQGLLVFEPISGDAIEATIDGTADLLLWIVDLALARAGDGTAVDPEPAYRVIGPPSRPAGITSGGN